MLLTRKFPSLLTARSHALRRIADANSPLPRELAPSSGLAGKPLTRELGRTRISSQRPLGCGIASAIRLSLALNSGVPRKSRGASDVSTEDFEISPVARRSEVNASIRRPTSSGSEKSKISINLSSVKSPEAAAACTASCCSAVAWDDRNTSETLCPSSSSSASSRP
ncbi:hypothetical protein C9890_0642 [Perkinsus sp. BL_2016]|nr:hypothetical protein C9890_0642 [Perkinsus sp. BL_2016]